MVFLSHFHFFSDTTYVPLQGEHYSKVLQEYQLESRKLVFPVGLLLNAVLCFNGEKKNWYSRYEQFTFFFTV